MSYDEEYGPWNPYTFSPPKKDPLLEKIDNILREVRGIQYELNILKIQLIEKYKEEKQQ